MSSSPPRHRGAPKGNLNALKHGFYTRRFNKRDLSGVESTDLKSLAEEIALIRVFTRRLVKSCDHSADFYELADTLRILCLASSTITRILRTHSLITGNTGGLDGEINQALNQFLSEFAERVESDEKTGEHTAADFIYNPTPEEMNGDYLCPK